MRYDHSVRALKTLLDRGDLGAPVLATIAMRAIPHWMPWAEGGRSLSTFIMSIHHLDTFRYWLGDPIRVLASTRPDPRTKFAHADGINLYLSNTTKPAPRPGTTSGPARCAKERPPRSGSAGGSKAPTAWPSARSAGLAGPSACPARIDYSTIDDDGRVAPPALARGVVPRRLRRHDGRLAPRPRIGRPSPTSRAATTSAPSPSARRCSGAPASIGRSRSKK